MTDMSKYIAPKSNQLNADDLIAGPRTITITRVKAAPSSAEQPIEIHFEGDSGKPYMPCKSMRRVMVDVWGADGSTYSGRSLSLFRDDGVQFGGIKVGGIRISHMSHIDAPHVMALTVSRKSRASYTVAPLKQEMPPKQDTVMSPKEAMEAIQSAANLDDLASAWKASLATRKAHPDQSDALLALKEERKVELTAPPQDEEDF